MAKEEEQKIEEGGIKKVVKKTTKKRVVKIAVDKVATKKVAVKATKKSDKVATKKIATKSKVKTTKKVVKKVGDKVIKASPKKATVKSEKVDKKIIKKIVKKPIVKKVATEDVVEKTRAKKAIIKKITTIKEDNKEYYKGIGRRKRAVANVRLYTGKDKIFIINNRPADIYFNTIDHKKIISEGLEAMNIVEKFKVEVIVRGGGLHAQAEAIRHGISRALLNFDEDFRVKLKLTGLLTRDPRRRERKKPGLKRARKATQWRKR